MPPFVSIIVPVYKVEKYLERCVNSILNQTYRNFEVLLIDDGSPDRCGELCEKIGKSDSRIRVFHKANGGLSDARNYGTDRAKGEFVTFIDSDDFVSENYLERMINLQKVHDADVVCCDFVRTSCDYGEFCGSKDTDLVFTGREACCALMGKYYLPLVIACCKLYKSEIVRKIPFPVGRIHEDEATTCKFLFSAEKVVLCRDKLYAYYQNPNSIMHCSNFDAVMWAFMERVSFFESSNDKYLTNLAWRMIIDAYIHEIIEKRFKNRCVFEFINRHKLFFKIGVKTWVKLAILFFFPGILRRRWHMER